MAQIPRELLGGEEQIAHQHVHKNAIYCFSTYLKQIISIKSKESKASISIKF